MRHKCYSWSDQLLIFHI